MAGFGEKAKKASAFLGSMIVWAIRIVLAPILIPLWYIPLGMYKLLRYGVRKFVWDDFFSYVLGTVVKNEKGRVVSVRFCTYGDLVHLHYAIWGALLCSLFAYLYPSHRDIVALFVVLLPIWCLVVIKWEFPFDRIWKTLLALLILVPLADYGIFKGTEIITANVFPWIQENASWTGITTEMIGGYEAIWVWKKAFHALGLDASPGLHLFAAIGWGIFFLVSVGDAWVYNRYELDEKDLYRMQLFKGESREPVYMRGMRIVIKDVFETFPFGFASLVIRINGRDRVLRNVPGLAFSAWLRGAMDALINSSAPINHVDPAAANAKKGENEEDLVRSFKEERGGDTEDHPNSQVTEADHLGDHDVSQDDDHDESSDLAGIQDELDAESNL
jgi:hypothetical protein